MNTTLLFGQCVIAEKVQIHRNTYTFTQIPCSQTGEEPATHWFCTMAGSEEKMMSIYAKKNLSIMELEVGPKEFLNKWNLKIIK